MRKITKGC